MEGWRREQKNPASTFVKTEFTITLAATYSSTRSPEEPESSRR